MSYISLIMYFKFILIAFLIFIYFLGVGAVFIFLICDDKHRSISEYLTLCLLSWYAYLKYLIK